MAVTVRAAVAQSCSMSRCAESFLYAILAICTLCAIPAHASDDTVVIIQESNGFPGAEESTGLARQQVSVLGGRLRVFDPRHNWALFVSVPDKTVREVAIQEREYVERSFAYYDRYRQERRETFAKITRQFEQQIANAESPSQRSRARQDYIRSGGDPDHPGGRKAHLADRPAENKTVKLTIDGEDKELLLEKWIVWENKRTDAPAFELFVSRELDIPLDLLAFYRELAPFGDEVNRQLDQIPGVVIECTAHIDAGSLRKAFHSRVLEIRTDQVVTPADVAVPGDYEEAQPDAPRPERQLQCSICRREVAEGEAFKYRDPRNGRHHFACSKDHLTQVLHKLADGSGH